MSTTKCIHCGKVFEKFFADERLCIICHQHRMVCVGKDCKSCNELNIKEEDR